MRARDVGMLVLLAAIWGGAFPLLRIAAPQFGPAPLIAVRVTVAAVALLALVGLAGQLRGRVGELFLLGLLNSAVPFTLFAFAALHITAGFAALLNATTPMFGAMLAYFWLGERLTAARAFGIAMGFGGVGSLVWSSLGAHSADVAYGVAAGLVGAALYGVAAAYARRRLGTVDPGVLSAGSLCGAAIALLPLAIWQWPTASPSPLAWLSAIVLGLVCTALAYILYFRLLRNVGVARATTVTFLIPVFGIAWGALLLGEPVTWGLIGGCALVLAGTALAVGRV